MATVQMNTRLESEVKDLGNTVFAQAGFAPSDVVRIVWQFAADNADNPAAVRQQLDSMAQRRRSPDREAKMAKAMRAPHLLEEMARIEGLELRRGTFGDDPRLQSSSNATLRELAADDGRLAKYGLVER